MEKKNIQRSRPTRALVGTPLYQTVMVYKRHLCGMAQYIMAPVVWTWTWTARACMVPSAHKEEVSGPLKPANKFR